MTRTHVCVRVNNDVTRREARQWAARGVWPACVLLCSGRMGGWTEVRILCSSCSCKRHTEQAAGKRLSHARIRSGHTAPWVLPMQGYGGGETSCSCLLYSGICCRSARSNQLLRFQQGLMTYAQRPQRRIRPHRRQQPLCSERLADVVARTVQPAQMRVVRQRIAQRITTGIAKRTVID